MDYAKVRGFNVHGDWGSHGITEWLNFDAERYEMMIRVGKERFPGMNTVRIWLSFDAYMADRTRYLQNVKRATQILTDAGLQIIPAYYNGWFGMPCFGGFAVENIQEQLLPIYERCTKDTTEALKDANILLFDVSNEPFNNAFGSESAFKQVLRFLERMTATIREMDPRPITIGSQGYPNFPDPNNRAMCDIDALAPLVDVFTLHPYNIAGVSTEDFDKQFSAVLDYVKPFGKPYLITECIWGAPTAEGRKKHLESELATYAKYNVGFLCHALFTCPVADLFPVEEMGCTDGLYMAFLDRDFQIRPHHDLFNRYS